MHMTETPDDPERVPIATQTRVPPEELSGEAEDTDDPDYTPIHTQTRVP